MESRRDRDALLNLEGLGIAFDVDVFTIIEEASERLLTLPGIGENEPRRLPLPGHRSKAESGRIWDGLLSLAETDRPFLGNRRDHKLADSIEDGPELGVILPLQALQLLG